VTAGREPAQSAGPGPAAACHSLGAKELSTHAFLTAGACKLGQGPGEESSSEQVAEMARLRVQLDKAEQRAHSAEREVKRLQRELQGGWAGGWVGHPSGHALAHMVATQSCRLNVGRPCPRVRHTCRH
jgi:hypothetical protein